MSTPFKSLLVDTVPIDADCVGNRWAVSDKEQLAKLIAIVAMGQALHAAQIIAQLKPASPALTHSALVKEATRQLTIQGDTFTKQDASRWRRDGFIFETISWIAAQQIKTAKTLLKDPHLRSTTQGIDGLIIELDQSGKAVARATVVEDKCVGDPRATFSGKILPCFKEHHENKRGPELVSSAASLIAAAGISNEAATAAAARVLDLTYRRYLAALTIEPADDNQAQRTSIFAGYKDLANITPAQRHAATFVVTGELREYFDELAAAAITSLENWPEDLDV